jgi:chromosome segregation ATPase
MNGTLRFNESAQIRLLEQQIDRSLATAEAEQADLTGEVTSLDERIKIVATLESETSATLIIIGTDVESLSGDFSTLQTEAQELDKRLVIIDERVVAMAAAAKDFDAFLEGLRTLLLEMEDGETEGAATAEATGTVEDPGKSPTAKATAIQPTRTPRPTATPLIPAASSPTPAR